MSAGAERAAASAARPGGSGSAGAAAASVRTLMPVTESFIDDCQTPVSAFLKLRALAPGEPAFLLESAEQGNYVGRWSFIGLAPRDLLRWSLADGGDPYALAEQFVGRFRQAPMDAPPPFTGGAVGYFGYDLVRTVEPLGEPGPDPIGLPDMALMLADVLVIFDHLKHTVTVLAHAEQDGGEAGGAAGAANGGPTGERDGSRAARPPADARERIAQIRAALQGPIPASGRGEHGEPRPTEVPRFEPNMSAEQFEAMVARIVRYIYAGDAFQVVPSQRWSARVPVEAFSIYRGLRAVNPSPYMYFLDFGDFQVAGASPEPLLRVNGRRVNTLPIAGTRPRGATPEVDERIARELLADPKERAEHVMLVDLGRNDLGRVCEAGSVEVESYMTVERYSHVMHIVSSVAGRLREGISAMDALRSVLPAGTLSGAPKVRAMQIIDELEPVKRGGYGGAIGYLSFAGDLDTCIHIRTVVVKDGVAHVQAGGGTVADAKPPYELAESEAKARAVMRAVELAVAEPTWP